MLVRAALKSDATVAITHSDTFTANELIIIASEGKGHVKLCDIKVEYA